MLSNLLPLAASALVVRAPMSTSTIYVAIVMVKSIVDHSGYHLTFLNR